MGQQQGLQATHVRDTAGQLFQVIEAHVQVRQAGQVPEAGGQRGQGAPATDTTRRSRVLTPFDDQGAQTRQVLGHLGQRGGQQRGVLVAAELQELHFQQLGVRSRTQVQQPLAASGVQVEAQSVPVQRWPGRLR